MKVKLVLVMGLSACVSLEGGGFRKQCLTDRYYCDGIAVGDLDRDGHLDVVAGPFCYYGPDFSSSVAFYPAIPMDPSLSPSNSMFSFIWDFNKDGWLDVLVLGRVHRHQAFWYENPGGRRDGWAKHFVFHRVRGESPRLADINGDGRPDLLTHNERHWGWISPQPNTPDLEWDFYSISEVGRWPQFYHGMGLGDFNQDRRLDILLNEGLYLQPSTRVGSSPWKKMPYVFSNDRGGAQMVCFDVDGDDDQDVVTSLNAHEWGLAWFENQGNTFERHMIMGDREEQPQYGVAFSQPHALEAGDLNGDGLPDIVTGKRMWAHGPTGDVEPNADPVIYWFELTRSSSGKTRFRPHEIDRQSGVGVQIALADLNGDQALDVLSASKLGTFVFFNELASRKLTH